MILFKMFSESLISFLFLFLSLFIVRFGLFIVSWISWDVFCEEIFRFNISLIHPFLYHIFNAWDSFLHVLYSVSEDCLCSFCSNSQVFLFSAFPQFVFSLSILLQFFRCKTILFLSLNCLCLCFLKEFINFLLKTSTILIQAVLRNDSWGSAILW